MIRIRPGALLLLLPALCGSCARPSADLLLTGGRIITLDPSRPSAASAAIAGDRILFVGPAEEALRHRGPETRVLDLRGATVVPGLIDTHVHLLAIGDYYARLPGGEPESHVDLSGSATPAEAAARVAARAAHTPKGEWIVGKGWSQVGWRDGRFPDSAELLSAAVPDHPVFLTRVDAHAAWVNQAALDLAGINSGTPEPEGGRILRDSRGRPTGVLVDRAVDPVLARLPPWSAAQRKLRLRLGLEALAAAGLTTVHVAGLLARPGLVWTENGQTEENVRLLEELEREGALPLRVQLYLEAPSRAAEWYLRQGKPPRSSPQLVAVRGIKLYADGAMGSWGALMEEPFADEPTQQGIRRLESAEMLRWLRMARRARFQVAIHALGDRAVTEALDALATVYGEKEDARAYRPRLEHLSATRPEDRQRLGRLGFVASIQPGFLYPARDPRFMEANRVGPSGEERLFAWRSLLQAGARLSGSSDSYGRVETPLQGIYAACTRTTPEGHPPGGWRPEERLSREEALRIYTQGGAWAGFEERTKGVVEKGRWADLTVLSADPLTCTDEELLKIEVLGTLVAGRFTHIKPALAGN